MSQHQAGLPVKRLKTALTWKDKDKATSQLARSDANQGGQRETVLPKGLSGDSSVDSSQSSDLGGTVPGREIS